MCESKGWKYVKLPNRSTETGQLLDRFLRGEEGFRFSTHSTSNERAAQLVFAANNHEHRDRIVEMIQMGDTVVLDRYVTCGKVYHEERVGPIHALDIEALNKGMPIPDVVLLLDMSPLVAVGREGYGEERNDNLERQVRILTLYRQSTDVTHIVNADQPPDAVLSVALELIAKHMDSVEQPLKYY
jgi:thymidylate kinase